MGKLLGLFALTAVVFAFGAFGDCDGGGTTPPPPPPPTPDLYKPPKLDAGTPVAKDYGLTCSANIPSGGCVGGLTFCDGANWGCVDLCTNQNSCGSCTNPCATGTVCKAGVCTGTVSP